MQHKKTKHQKQEKNQNLITELTSTIIRLEKVIMDLSVHLEKSCFLGDAANAATAFFTEANRIRRSK